MVALPLVEIAAQKYCHKAQHQEGENRSHLQLCCMLNLLHSNLPQPVENHVITQESFPVPKAKLFKGSECYNKIQVIKQIKSTSKTRLMTRGNHLHVKTQEPMFYLCSLGCTSKERHPTVSFQQMLSTGFQNNSHSGGSKICHNVLGITRNFVGERWEAADLGKAKEGSS